MEAEPGIFILFENCREHLPAPLDSSIKIFNQRISTTVLPTLTIAKCAHIHCYECGCIKSRTECIMAGPSKMKLSTPGPISNEMFEQNQNVLSDRFAGKIDTKPYDYEKVEATGPEKIHFNIEWSYEGNDFFCSGNLPTDIASAVIKAVNS